MNVKIYNLFIYSIMFTSSINIYPWGTRLVLRERQCTWLCTAVCFDMCIYTYDYTSTINEVL